MARTPIERLVTAVRRRLWLGDLRRRLHAALFASAVVIALAALPAYLAPWFGAGLPAVRSAHWPLVLAAALLPPAGALARGIVAALRGRPDAATAALVADRLVGADGLLVTAWELGSPSSPTTRNGRSSGLAPAVAPLVASAATRALADWEASLRHAAIGPAATRLAAPSLLAGAAALLLLTGPGGALAPAAADLPGRAPPPGTPLPPDGTAALRDALARIAATRPQGAAAGDEPDPAADASPPQPGQATRTDPRPQDLAALPLVAAWAKASGAGSQGRGSASARTPADGAGDHGGPAPTADPPTPAVTAAPSWVGVRRSASVPGPTAGPAAPAPLLAPQRPAPPTQAIPRPPATARDDGDPDPARRALIAAYQARLAAIGDAAERR